MQRNLQCQIWKVIESGTDATDAVTRLIKENVTESSLPGK